MEKVFQKLDFSKNMYAIAMAYLEKHLKHLTTEGKGDCWLLAIMADFEVTNPELVAGLDAEQREEICTSRRGDIVTWAADTESNGGFRLLCEMCGIRSTGTTTWTRSRRPRRRWSRGLSLGAKRRGSRPLKRKSKSAISSNRTKSKASSCAPACLASDGQCSNRCHRARRGVRGCMVVFQLLGVHSHFHNASGERLEWTGTSGVEDRHQSQ